jgi:chromosomal replication initiation ATPase DnaA
MTGLEIPSEHCVFKTPYERTCEELVEIARWHGLTIGDIRSANRDRHIVRARDEAIAHLRAKGWTYPRIGQFFNRDHSTCVVAFQRYEARANA